MNKSTDSFTTWRVPSSLFVSPPRGWAQGCTATFKFSAYLSFKFAFCTSLELQKLSSIHNKMASLNALPTELQCAVFCLLDPVGLISISQTNRAFRNTIQPTRKNFLERLLQLELDERQGGNTPLFNPRTNALSPAWTEPEWKLMRWACSGCLRLRPAEYFDNHSILRLAYRKPISGSPASKPYTSWEATPKASPFLPHVRREQRPRSDQCIEEKRIRRRYGLASSKRWTAIAYATEAEDTYNELQGCGWIAWEDSTLTEFLRLDPEQKKAIFDEEVNAIEKLRCGYKRHLRKCHECRYQSGQLKPKLIGSGGIARIPVVTSRQYRIPTIMDRYYPRFSEELQNKRPTSNPPSYAIYRANVRDRFWPMYMIRCPDCEKWKEQRMFMTGLSYLSNIPGTCHTKLTSRYHIENEANETERKTLADTN